MSTRLELIRVPLAVAQRLLACSAVCQRAKNWNSSNPTNTSPTRRLAIFLALVALEANTMPDCLRTDRW